MKSTGAIRHIDAFGRIGVPKKAVQRLRLSEGDAFEVFTGANEIILRKFAPDCAFCGGEVGLSGVTFKAGAVCADCAQAFADMLKGGCK